MRFRIFCQNKNRSIQFARTSWIWVLNQKIRGKPPKRMVKIMENPIKMDDFGGNTPIFGNTHLVILFSNHGEYSKSPRLGVVVPLPSGHSGFWGSPVFGNAHLKSKAINNFHNHESRVTQFLKVFPLTTSSQSSWEEG